MTDALLIPIVPAAGPARGAGEPARERLELAHAAAGLGMWDWDVEADLLHWDEGARALHGLAGGAPVSGEIFLSRVHPDDRERLLAEVRASVDPAVRGPCEVSYRVATDDGERWIHSAGRVEWAGDGAAARAVRVLGIMRDDTRARAAERALAERDERLRAALYASRTGTFRWDIRTGALDWDENLDRLFGLVPGQTVRSLDGFVATVHPDDRARVAAACERCAAEGADFDEEFRVVWPDGGVHWLDDKGRTFLDGDGRPAYMTGACVDITERKRAAEERERLHEAGRAAAALAQQRLAELEAVYAGAPVGMAVLDRSLRYVRVNAQMAALHGRPAAEHLGRTPAEMIPFPVDGLVPLLQGVLDTGRPVPSFPVRAVLPGTDEERTWLVTYYPIGAAGGGVAGVGAVVDEITDLERTAAALRQSEGRLRRIMESGIVGAFFWNVEGGITEANDAFLDLLGYTCGDLEAGRIDWRRLTPPAWKAEDERRVAELLATGHHGPYEKEYLSADGRPIPVLIASAFFHGSRTEGVALCLDRTAQCRAEDALRDALGEMEAARAEAESANQAKSAFLASMSHELRTPLNAISGYVDLIDMGIRGPVTEAQAQDLARIRRSTRHLLGLINDVLSFARIDAGSLHYDVADVPLPPLLADAEAMLATQADARGVRLTVHPCPPGVRIRADADKVRQILLNLVGNAIKFTPAGGAVEVSCVADGGVVRVEVRDTGVGIPADKLQAVFEPFVQLNRKFSSPGEGVGLGLAISRELARAMGGELTADSILGDGSVFTLVLPQPPASDG